MPRKRTAGRSAAVVDGAGGEPERVSGRRRPRRRSEPSTTGAAASRLQESGLRSMPATRTRGVRAPDSCSARGRRLTDWLAPSTRPPSLDRRPSKSAAAAAAKPAAALAPHFLLPLRCVVALTRRAAELDETQADGCSRDLPEAGRLHARGGRPLPPAFVRVGGFETVRSGI